MNITIHEHFRLRPGMRVKLIEGPAKILRVTAAAAVCRLEIPKVREFKSRFGVPVRIALSGATVRISPNAEVKVL